TEPSRDAPLADKATPYVELINPISSERRVMRHSVLASILGVAAANLRHASAARLFEIGAVYLPRLGENLPAEPRRLALLLTGERHLEYWQDRGTSAQPAVDSFDLKRI